MEGVHDSLPGNEVVIVARITHERPTGADRPIVLDQDCLHGEAFADFRARLSCSVDEQLVEYRASRAVRDRRFSCAWRANNREKTEAMNGKNRAHAPLVGETDAPPCGPGAAYAWRPALSLVTPAVTR
jgi:hypothetical protein